MAMITIPVHLREWKQVPQLRVMLKALYAMFEDPVFLEMEPLATEGATLKKRFPPWLAASMRCSDFEITVPRLPRHAELPLLFVGRAWHPFRVVLPGQFTNEHRERIRKRASRLSIAIFGPALLPQVSGLCMIADKRGLDHQVLAHRLGCKLEPVSLRELLLD